LESNDNSSKFTIDELSGVLTTSGNLDREEKDFYELKVVASDLGEPPLSTSLQLLINIVDINDNAPRFSRDHYELTVSEETQRGKQLFEFIAVDRDSSDSKLSYRIEHMDRPLFALIQMGANEGAILSLAKEFSPLDEIIHVRVSATDSVKKLRFLISDIFMAFNIIWEKTGFFVLYSRYLN
jgi:hypothetical protein